MKAIFCWFSASYFRTFESFLIDLILFSHEMGIFARNASTFFFLQDQMENSLCHQFLVWKWASLISILNQNAFIFRTSWSRFPRFSICPGYRLWLRSSTISRHLWRYWSWLSGLWMCLLVNWSYFFWRYYIKWFYVRSKIHKTSVV